MSSIETGIPGLLLFEPTVMSDERGYFLETWHAERYRSEGIQESFVQDNLSFSRKGVLRGLHYQHPHAQGKLVSVLQGEVFDVAVDLRQGSPAFGQWVGFTLSAENRRQLYIPPGCAHGFVVTGEGALFHYKCTDFYSRASEGTIRWDDPDLGIAWPVQDPILSAKDAVAQSLRDTPPERLPSYG